MQLSRVVVTVSERCMSVEYFAVAGRNEGRRDECLAGVSIADFVPNVAKTLRGATA